MAQWAPFRWRKLFFYLLLLACFFSGPALADPSISLEISGEGVTNPLTFTREELEAMEQYQQLYSTINTWPTKRWYMARGVKLRELLALAGIKEEATLLKFIGKDNYEVTLTVKELLEDKRYYFPGLKENHPTDGSIPGSPEGAVEVEPIIALVGAEDSVDPAEMDERHGLMLVVGQRAVTEQTWPLFIKQIQKIQVLTAEPEKWDPPKTYVPDGSTVPLGFKLELTNKDNDLDKIYYTTDGSTPTVDSPMFNWSARRWWDQREEGDSVNLPIEIIAEMLKAGQKEVVFKARTIGPGKLDSDVITFTFKVDPEAQDPTKLPAVPPSGISLDRSSLQLPIGGSFRLEASVEPFNALDKRVAWHSSDTRVATVDTGGLVTVVGEGTAVITAETADGRFRALCVVNGPAQLEKEEEVRRGEEEEQVPGAGAEDEREEAPSRAPASPSSGEDEQSVPAKTQEEIPESRKQYLREKTGTDGHEPELEEVSPQQAFEVSLESYSALTLPARKKNAHPQAAVLLLLFFLSGAGRRYLEYAKELKNS
ncbi:MAG: hypothetical protein GX779_00475 [Clostridia bacterium]|nr:hypothetical protein [Clostridia bacterium]